MHAQFSMYQSAQESCLHTSFDNFTLITYQSRNQFEEGYQVSSIFEWRQHSLIYLSSAPLQVMTPKVPL